MFGIGPAYLFVLQQRLPVGLLRSGWQPWLSAMATNLGDRRLVATLIWLIGVKAFLLVHVPISCSPPRSACGCSTCSISSSNDWASDDDWSLQEAALHGSSHYDLPASCAGSRPTSASTTSTTCAAGFPIIDCGGRCATIPSCAEVGRVTLMESLRCMRLALWDEDRRRLVSFREARVGGLRRVEVRVAHAYRTDRRHRPRRHGLLLSRPDRAACRLGHPARAHHRLRRCARR